MTTDLNRDGDGATTETPQGTPVPDVTPSGSGTSQTPEDFQAHIKRLNDENAQRRREANELREKLEAAEREKSKALQADLEKRQEWQALAEARQQEIDSLKPLQAKVQSMSETIDKLLAAQIEQLPPETRKMIETMPGDDVAKLNWLSENAKLLHKMPLSGTDAGTRSDPAPKNAQYTEEQQRFAALLGTKLK